MTGVQTCALPIYPTGDEVRRDPRTGDEMAGVTVTVSQAARHDLRLGGGVGLDPYAVEVRGRAVYSVAAWPWPTTTSRIELRPAMAIQRDDQSLSPRIDASASIDRLDFVRPRYTGAAEAAYSYLAVEAYTSRGPRLRLSARSPRPATRARRSRASCSPSARAGRW